MMNELGALLSPMPTEYRWHVLTGSEKAFAAGADIAAMADYTYPDTYTQGYISRNWEHILRVRKPVVGAVAGYALGGGCELAMMCDFLIAADSAKFGQPEIKVGVTRARRQARCRAPAQGHAMDLFRRRAPSMLPRRNASASCRAWCRLTNCWKKPWPPPRPSPPCRPRLP